MGLEVGWLVYLGRDWAGDADHESEFMRFLQYDDSIHKKLRSLIQRDMLATQILCCLCTRQGNDMIRSGGRIPSTLSCEIYLYLVTPGTCGSEVNTMLVRYLHISNSSLSRYSGLASSLEPTIHIQVFRVFRRQVSKLITYPTYNLVSPALMLWDVGGEPIL